MLPELKQLIDVQEVDKIILEVTGLLEKIPEDLRMATQILEDLAADLNARTQELEGLKKQKQDTEAEVAEMEDSIKKSRQRLMEIKSNIEYKAMLKEIAFKEDQRDQNETRILELLELIGNHGQRVAELEQRLQEQSQVLERLREEAESQTAKLQEQLGGLQGRRQEMRQGIPAALLKRYEFIRSRRNGSAVAPVSEGVCMGCHMNILPQQFIDLQKGVEILQCPHCQRILFWQDEEETDEEPQLSQSNGR